MSVDKDVQEEFARQMQEEYHEETLLPEICNRQFYSETDKNLEYVQIGKRTPIPVEVFRQGILKPTTHPMARSIVTGEENFVLNDLVNAAEDGVIESAEMEELSYSMIEEAVERVDDADTVFIPYADSYTTEVNDWLREGLSVSGGTQLQIQGNRLDIRRITPSFGIKDVLVTNSDEIDLVQKRAEDTSLPKGLDVDDSMLYVNEGKDFMVYFDQETDLGEPDDEYDEFLDVVFRVVISQPMPSSDSAIRLEAPAEITLSGDDEQA